MNLPLLYCSFAVLLPALLLQSAFEHALERSATLPAASRPIVAWGLLALAGYATFWACLAAPWLGRLLVGLLLLAAIAYWVRERRSFRTTWFGSDDGHFCRFAIVLLGAGYIALLCLRQSELSLDDLAASRFTGPLPVDNQIPRILADRLQAGESPRHVLGDWLSSDRPPLQSGIILLLRLAAPWSGDAKLPAFFASVLFQLLWIPGLWALLRGLGARRTETAVAATLTGCTGFCLLHSIYTWPKLGAAGLVLGGASLLLDRSTNSKVTRWSVGAGLCALGFLAHGGVVFSLIALAPLTLFLRPNKASLAGALAAFVLLLLPWTLYQKFYDPPGNRLLKWHLAGVVPVDNRGTLETLRASYREAGWSGTLRNKEANVAPLFEDGPWRIFDLSPARAEDRRAAEFFHFFRGLGLASWLLLLLPLLAWRLRADDSNRPLLRSCGVLLVWSALTLIGWILLMFGPATTVIHQGSLAPLLVLGAIPVVALWRYRRGAVAVVAVAQLGFFLTTWVPASRQVNGLLSHSSMLVAGVAAVLLGGLVLLIQRHDQETAVGSVGPI